MCQAIKRCVSLHAAVLSGVMLVASAASAQTPGKAGSLDALLGQIEQEVEAGEAEQQERIEEFDRKKAEQASLLEKARAQEKAEEAKSAKLEAQFQENERRLAEEKDLLKERMGSLGELFGVVRQVAGDTGALVRDSIVSAQLPDRHQFLEELGQSKELPSIDQLEKLWFTLQQEATEQGRVVQFETKVTGAGGKSQVQTVTRVGTFNLVSDGKFLGWKPRTGEVFVLGRQPEARYTSLVDDLERAKSGYVNFAIDPSRGTLLGLLVQTPDFEERLEAGGEVGLVIQWLGGIAAVLGLLRLLYLLVVSAMVRAQVRSPRAPKKSNPLGRVLLVYKKSSSEDVETLERKLDEAVLRETSALDRFLWMVKVASVIAPLLGLLGTVTGMIQTFQQITLFGTGDPKLMAGGISEALVTTMLGLMAAIPLVLLHSLLRSISRRTGDVLQEQAAGLIAVQAEGHPAHPGEPTPSMSGSLKPAEGN